MDWPFYFRLEVAGRPNIDSSAKRRTAARAAAKLPPEDDKRRASTTPSCTQSTPAVVPPGAGIPSVEWSPAAAAAVAPLCTTSVVPMYRAPPAIQVRVG